RSIADKDLEENSRGWAEAARGVYADLLRTERAAKTDPAAAAAVSDIREKIDSLWKNSKGPSLFLDVVAAPIVNEEATYLLALGKHEQAERQGHRPDSANAAPLWETTRKWWLQFLNTFPNSASSGAARRNLAAALAAEGNSAAAKAELVSLT